MCPFEAGGVLFLRSTGNALYITDIPCGLKFEELLGADISNLCVVVCVCAYVCVCSVGMCTCKCRCWQSLEEGVKFLGAGFTGGYGQFHVGAGNGTWIFFKSSVAFNYWVISIAPSISHFETRSLIKPETLPILERLAGQQVPPQISLSHPEMTDVSHHVWFLI